MRHIQGQDVRAFVIQLLASVFFFSEDLAWMTDDLFRWGSYLLLLLLFVTSAAYAVERPGRALLMPCAAALVLMILAAAFSPEGLGSHLLGLPVYAVVWAAHASWPTLPGALVGLAVRALCMDGTGGRWARV